MKYLKSASSLQQRALSLSVFHLAPRITLMSVGSPLSGSRLLAASLSDKRSAGSAGSLDLVHVVLCSHPTTPSKAAPGQASSRSPLPRSHSVVNLPSVIPAAALKSTYRSWGGAGASRFSRSYATANVPRRGRGKGGCMPPSSCQGFPSQQPAGGFHICPAAGLIRREGNKAKCWDPKC